jgi:hypothetical protein
MSTVALREHQGGGGVLLDDFDERAVAIAGMAASPNTRRAYATAYRAFADFLRAHDGEASKDTVTITSVAAWRDELTGPGPRAKLRHAARQRRPAARCDAGNRPARPAGAVYPRPAR